MSNIFRDDIQVGDIIKVTEIDQGVRVERSGAVGTIGNISGSLYSAEGGALWVDGWAGKYSFDLIDRPKPQLPLKEGTVIIVQDLPVETGPVTLIRRDSQRTGRWEYLNGQGYYSTEQVQNRSWKLAKVVEA